MFTVCPKCALTLVVTAADLRVAQGYVRCGRCLHVFNALARLSEERPAAAPPPPPPAAQPSLDDTGEIEIELDASVLLASTQARCPPETAEREEQPGGASPAEPVAGERVDHPEPPAPTEHAAAMEQPVAMEQGAAVEQPAPEEVASVPAAGPRAAPDDADARDTAAVAGSGETVSTVPPDSATPRESAEPAAAAEAPDGQQAYTPQEQLGSDFELEARRPRERLVWKLGAGALAIALALQIVNHYRDALAARPALGAPLSAVYSTLGVKLAQRWNVHAYHVRQLGASVAGVSAGEIIVRASVKNSASRAQPLPLLRVTLQDRFGNRIAARDVPPSDYLPSSGTPSAFLAAGSRVDATMVFVDPGPQAVGFEIDACLRQRSGQVACAHGPW